MALPRPISVARMIQSVTDFNCERLYYSWTIHNFGLCTDGIGKKIESPIFKADNGSEWVLHLYPNGLTSQKPEVCVVLHLHSLKGIQLQAVKYIYYVLWNAKQKSLNRGNISVSKFFYDTFQSPRGGYPHSCTKREELLALLGDDSLTITCELFIRGDRIDHNMQNILPVPKCTLSDHFGSMFKDQKFGDTVIEVGGRTFLVYRGILQARSAVFAAMFQHEHAQNKVIISDFEPEVVEEMLTYIYTGKSPNIQAMANDLLSIADKYDLDQLKIMSADVLSTKLSLENAIETLILADLHGANYLKNFVINFIVINRIYYLSAAVWENIMSVLSTNHPIVFQELTNAILGIKINVSTV